MTPPSSIQRLLQRLLPRRWAESMEAESRQWLVVCPCGESHSVWELGGIRWKAAGEPRRPLRCETCGEVRWHRVTKKAAEAAAPKDGPHHQAPDAEAQDVEAQDVEAQDVEAQDVEA